MHLDSSDYLFVRDHSKVGYILHGVFFSLPNVEHRIGYVEHTMEFLNTSKYSISRGRVLSSHDWGISLGCGHFGNGPHESGITEACSFLVSDRYNCITLGKLNSCCPLGNVYVGADNLRCLCWVDGEVRGVALLLI